MSNLSNVKSLTDEQVTARIREVDEDRKLLLVEIQRRANITPAQRLADRLHRLLHMKLECDYSYSDWPGPLSQCREDFLQLAERLLSDEPTTTNIVYFTIEEMEKIRYGSSYTTPTR